MVQEKFDWFVTTAVVTQAEDTTVASAVSQHFPYFQWPKVLATPAIVLHADGVNSCAKIPALHLDHRKEGSCKNNGEQCFA